MLKKVLVLSVLIGFGGCALAEGGNLGARINLKAPAEISSRANKSNEGYSSDFDSSIYNPMINGMGNLMQGMTGNVSNIHQVQEMQKMQTEYVKQMPQDGQE